MATGGRGLGGRCPDDFRSFFSLFLFLQHHHALAFSASPGMLRFWWPLMQCALQTAHLVQASLVTPKSTPIFVSCDDMMTVLGCGDMMTKVSVAT